MIRINIRIKNNPVALITINNNANANATWAFATSKRVYFPVLARIAEASQGDFSAQNLANATWAFATAKLVNYPALARIAEPRQSDFSLFPQQLY